MKLNIMKTTVLMLSMLFPIISWGNNGLYVESDPIAFALKGHSLHIGLEGDHFRFQVGTFGATLPNSFKDNAKFDVKQSGYGVKLDYFRHKQGGFFVGVEYAMTEMEFQQTVVNERTNRDANLLGIRAGYKYRMNKTFYVMPWVGVDRNISDTSSVKSSGENYLLDKWIIFPTVHLGMQF